MDLVKAIIFFTIIALDVLIPAHTISRTSYDYASKPQVLGKRTNLLTPPPFAIKTFTATRASEIKEGSPSAPLRLRQEIKNSTMTATNEAKKMVQHEADKEKIRKEKEYYRSQLEHIKDVKKKQVVQTINTKIASINKNSTDRLSAALDKLTSILTSISNKVTLISSTHDTTSLGTDILEAQVTITEAQAEVLTQSSKEYILDIASDEAKLKGSVAPVVTAFHKDMSRTHQFVIDAKEAVIRVYKTFRELKSPTPSP